MLKLREYLWQIIFIPLFTLMLIKTSELDVRIVLSIAVVVLSLLTGFSVGLDWRKKK